MRANLHAHGIDPAAMPTVLQYNKRDLPDALPVAAMDGDLNRVGLPRVEAVAVRGTGVRDTFELLASATIGKALGALKVASLSPARLHEAIVELLPDEPQPVAEAVSARNVYDLASVGNEAGDETGSLLRKAVSGALQASEDLASAKELLKALERRRAELAWLAEAASATADLTSLVRGAVQATGAGAGTLMLLRPGHALEEVARHGAVRDPLNNVEVPGLGSLAFQLARSRKALLSHDVQGDLLTGRTHPDLKHVRTVVAAPLLAGDSALGLFALYDAGPRHWSPGADELRFARVAAALLVARVTSGTRASATAPAHSGAR
jgi:GAF domain-containing protein